MTVNVKRKAAIYATSLIEAFPHIGRSNPCICLTKDISEHHRLSKDVSETEKEFVQANLTRGKLFLLPDEEKALRQIEEQARFATKKRTLVMDYILYKEYDELCREFEEKRKAYFELRDKISEVWSERMCSFSRGLAEYLQGRGFNTEEVAKMHKSLMSKLPTKEEWYESFYFNLEVREYPASPGSLPGLDKKWEERTENLTRSLLAEQITTLFEKASNVLSNLMEGKSYTRRLNTLLAGAGNILNHRILNESDFTELVENIVAIPVDMGDEDTVEAIEDCMANLILFADKSNIYLDLSECPVTKEYLLSLSSVDTETDFAVNSQDQAEDEPSVPAIAAETAQAEVKTVEHAETFVLPKFFDDGIDNLASPPFKENEGRRNNSEENDESFDVQIPSFDLNDCTEVYDAF